MFFWFLIGTLAAMGFLCLLWCVASLLFCRDGNSIWVCLCRNHTPFPAITRFRILRAMGLLQGLLLLVDSGLSADEQTLLCRSYSFIRFCHASELSEVLTWEDTLLD